MTTLNQLHEMTHQQLTMDVPPWMDTTDPQFDFSNWLFATFRHKFPREYGEIVNSLHFHSGAMTKWIRFAISCYVQEPPTADLADTNSAYRLKVDLDECLEHLISAEFTAFEAT